MDQIKILIVDDDIFWAKKLSVFLNNEPDLLVIGIAQSQEEAEEFIKHNDNFDIVLMDLNLSGNSQRFEGIECTEAISQLNNKKVIVVTAYTVEELVTKAFMAGAKNYFPKDHFQDLPFAIRGVFNNKYSAMEILVKEFFKLKKEFDLTILSPTEKKVHLLIEQGYSNTEIAKELVISMETVKSHVHNILNKLNAKSRKQIVKKLSL
ncbi:MAG TPA: response regulator transcription factor [Bacillota bacterium]|nr:response regulator transcription factor [Bacillota bacterium]